MGRGVEDDWSSCHFFLHVLRVCWSMVLFFLSNGLAQSSYSNQDLFPGLLVSHTIRGNKQNFMHHMSFEKEFGLANGWQGLGLVIEHITPQGFHIN